MSRDTESILILGCGYVGERVAAACLSLGMRVIGTTRDERRAAALSAQGMEAVVAASPLALPEALLASMDLVLDSIPLERDESGMRAGQPLWLPELAGRLTGVRWAGYLSTTGVYGDAGGAWVDESFVCRPGSARGLERLRAEQAWLSSGLPAEVFRLAGIYGPERNILGRLKAGGYKAVRWNPAHYSSRIHVDDIVAAVISAMRSPGDGRIVNLADDMPLPHADYVCEVARMIGAPLPEILTEAEGEAQLSPAMLDFFRDNKRISNRLLHRELLTELKYPDFRSGMQSLIRI
ncbi:SDR family oxidoreductase [Mariprofundus ferrooxydans]|uniref:SDR family oxidoreductase n=1 Tax=Mariprofundus ferrooxydans TaxID=314344 RepID=UPI0019816551|nr:SDR family oxidoreductase [Mariprofundus ferrooxydans]